MPLYQTLSTLDDQTDSGCLQDLLRAQLPRMMREQLTPQTQTQAYFLLTMLSDDACVRQLRRDLQQQYPAIPTTKTPIEQALTLIAALRQIVCDPAAAFKYRLPIFLGEYPIHSRVINREIKRFNQLIETYHENKRTGPLDAKALNEAYQAILTALEKHYMGAMTQNLWQLLQALTGWATTAIDALLPDYPYLLSPIVEPDNPASSEDLALPNHVVETIAQPLAANKQATGQAFTSSFDYDINAAGRMADSNYLLINGFGLKPGGHADALNKKIPDFLPWVQWQASIRRQLSQLIDIKLDKDFFDWLQAVLNQLGIDFVVLQHSAYHCYVSPFLNQKTAVNTLNDDQILSVLNDQCQQMQVTIDPAQLAIIGRYLLRFLYAFQFNRGEALGIGANWGGVVSDSNEAGADAFRFNDDEWAAVFKQLSTHRQGPAEARMNASIGIKYELAALVSNFDYITRLQRSEYNNTLFSALVDNLITSLFPEPAYFENTAYPKHRCQYVVSYTDAGMPQINFFYQLDSQGTYYKTKKEGYKQTPMFRQAGSLEVESFPRDIGSGECCQSLSVANPLWPLQLQYAQSMSSSVRGHVVYNPVAPDSFVPDTFYGQVIRESGDIFIPFIGVVPKNFDSHFNQVELCASFVVRMMQSSRLMTHCPIFSSYYQAIMTRFLPAIDKPTPALPDVFIFDARLRETWQAFDSALHDVERTAIRCHKSFFALVKTLIYSLYPLTKNNLDLHYYFVELTNNNDAFEPANRPTCERLIRELTTLKPLPTLDNGQHRQQYDDVGHYLKDLVGFFYPNPCDNTAQVIAEQAHLHAKHLLTLPEIKAYFADLSRQPQANISPKVSPGLMHDVLKYQGPSPDITGDFYHRRHDINFIAGFRDLEGGQIVEPSTREKLLDKTIKTVGALIPLVHRNKTFLSVLTQPFAQAYMSGYQSYATTEQHKWFWTLLSGIGGFIYGLGVGIGNVLTTIPRTIYHGWLAPTHTQHQAHHPLAISSAPSNEPGLRAAAIRASRDYLLQCMATMNEYASSSEQLSALLLTHVKTIYPTLLSNHLITEVRYKAILTHAFPLDLDEWQHLFEPIIAAEPQSTLQKIINQYNGQIDRIVINALHDYLTMSKDTKLIIDKYKLNRLQAKALTALINYYANDVPAQQRDVAQYSFPQGSAMTKLKRKENILRKLQIWMNHALDKQWILEQMFSCFIEHYQWLLAENNLTFIAANLPHDTTVILHELLTHPGQEETIVADYLLEPVQEAFLLNYVAGYRKMAREQELILAIVEANKKCAPPLSIKAQEHLKFVEFRQREWRHQLLTIDDLAPIVTDIKKQCPVLLHAAIDGLVMLYKAGLEDANNPQRFDAFYYAAVKIQGSYGLKSPLREWLDVTMNIVINQCLDKLPCTNSNDIINPLSHSPAIGAWLVHLLQHRHGIRSLLTQQIEQTTLFDDAAWRCQHILKALETAQPDQGYIRHTGMQKLLRIICQNADTRTPTGEQKSTNVPIAALCRYSITMQHALERVKQKIPNHDFVRALDVASLRRL